MAGTIFHTDQDAPAEMVLDDLPDGATEKWRFHVVFAADLGNPDLQNGVGHGASRSAMAGRILWPALGGSQQPGVAAQDPADPVKATRHFCLGNFRSFYLLTCLYLLFNVTNFI